MFSKPNSAEPGPVSTTWDHFSGSCPLRWPNGASMHQLSPGDPGQGQRNVGDLGGEAGRWLSPGPDTVFWGARHALSLSLPGPASYNETNNNNLLTPEYRFLSSLVPRSGRVRNQLIPTQAEGLRGTHSTHLDNLIQFLLLTALHSCPAVQFHSPHPGQG